MNTVHCTRTVKNMSNSVRHQKLSSSSSNRSSCTTTNRASSKWWLSRRYTKSKYLLYYGIGIPLFGGFTLILLQGRTFVRVNNTNSNNDNVNVDIDYIDTLPTIVETISTETLPNGDTVTTTTTSSTTTTAIINENNNDNNESNNNNNTNNNTDNDNDGRPIELLLSIEDGIWIRDRSKQFQKWFKESKNITIIKQTSKNKKLGNDKFSSEQLLKLNSDAILPGPILDFVIVGSAKTGTTTLMTNLGKIAPMPSAKDVCLSPENILSMVYNDWPQQYNVTKIIIPSLLELELNDNNNNDTKPFKQEQQEQQHYGIHLKGSKCPSLLGLPMLKRYSQALPKTKFIIGIRHPITWFQSFWKMQGNDGPYERTQICPCAPHDNPTQNNLFKNESQIYDSLTRRCTIIPEKEPDNNNSNSKTSPTNTIVVGCKNECGYKLFCTARARFHLSLARLGKTRLTSHEERNLLAPNDPDGGVAENGLRSWNVTNDIFVYDQTQLNEDYLWEGLASFLKVSRIPHDTNQRQYSKGKNQSQLDICDPLYDSFRAIMMKSAYEMSVWLEHYFLPVALDSNRTDVTIVSGPNNEFLDIIQSYKLDPCERLLLVRTNDNNSNDNKSNNNIKYILDPSFNTTIIPPPPNRKEYDYQIRTVADDDPSNNNNNNNKREKKKKDLKKDKERRARKQQGKIR